MPMNTTTGAPILTPEQVGTLVVQPLTQMSVAGQVSTTVTTGSKNFRIPQLTGDPTASWVAEGAEIPTSDATLDELDVTPDKLAALVPISHELAVDSTPAAADVIGQRLVVDLQRKMDAAYFGTTVTNGPDGLGSLAGVSTVTAGASWSNLDPFSDAQFAVEEHNGTVSAWVANPADAAILAKLKQGTASGNVPLLGADPTQPGRRQILGPPLLTSPYVTAGTVWGIDRRYAYIVLREDATVFTDTSVFLSSDRVAVFARLRIGFAWPNPGAIVKVSLTAP